MSDFRAGDADGLTEAGMKHMLDWLHNYAEGQVTKKQDVVMCDLLAYEIERLRRDERLWRNRVDEAAKRIEELEKESEWKAMKQLLCADYHIITTDQIRAAWRDAIFATRPDEEQTEFLEARQLGIVRCECGDGFVIGGEDE